jgi:hypothetical protein
MKPKEPTIFKIRLLKPMAYNGVGDILKIKYIDTAGNLYYYDDCRRWCYQSYNKEGVDWEKIK